MNIHTTVFTFTNDKQQEVHVSKWTPEDDTSLKAAVQIAHGAAEHIARYGDFAKFLAGHGYVVYGNDHRGHGKTAETPQKLGCAGQDGWNGMVRDCQQLTDIIRKNHPGLPVYLFGHSMGSAIARDYVQQFPDEAAGLILSGSFRVVRYLENTQDFIDEAEQIMRSQGPEVASESFGAALGRFNLDFADQPGVDWLTRDPQAIQKYIDDPLCGFAFSVELTRDFCRGIEKINTPEELRKIRRDLPILVITGEKDPVHNHLQYIDELLADYNSIGMQDVTKHVYPEARHEVLNETNREDVYQDVLHWLNQKAAS